MKILIGGLLVLSLALNLFLWSRYHSRGQRLITVKASANKMDDLRRRNQEVQISQGRILDSAVSDALELARLRNEVEQLRKQAEEMAALRARAAEAELLGTQLAAATLQLAIAEQVMADTARLSPDELRQEIEKAQSVRCINNLRQIGLAAHIWANSRNDVFPPDFISMKEELENPKVLFCPADAAAVPVHEWSRLNPGTISYRFLNPNGNLSDPRKPLTFCPFHGHYGVSDGSVYRQY